MHTDEVLNLLRSYAEVMDYSFKLGSLGNNRINSKYIYKGVELTVWFQHDKLSKKDTFGFDMFQGGSKVFTDFEEFKTLVSIYLLINGDIIPIAKNIADVFEKVAGVNSVYKNFKGNQEQGYIIIFNVLNNSNNEIRVKLISDNEYTAQLIEYSEEEGKVNVIYEKHYSVDDVGNITLIPTIEDYIENLYSRYSSSDTVNIRRYAQNSFEFDIDSKIHINATIKVSNMDFVYLIHSAVDLNGNEYVKNGDIDVVLKDSTDLSELKDYFIKKQEVSSISDLIDERKSNTGVVSMEEVFDEFEDSINESVEEVFDYNESNDSISNNELIETVKEANDESVIESESVNNYNINESSMESKSLDSGGIEEVTDKSVNKDSEIDIEDVQENKNNTANDTNINESSMESKNLDSESIEEVADKSENKGAEIDIEDVQENKNSTANDTNINEEDIRLNGELLEEDSQNTDQIEIKLVKENGVLKDVRFSYPDKIFDVNIDTAVELGLPVNRIGTIVSRELRRGILITDEEISKRVFSKDISEDIDFCKNLVFDFFL